MKTRDILRFYLGYLWYKLILIPFETKDPKWKLYINELYYVAGKVVPSISKETLPFRIPKVTTRFGTFKIRPDALDDCIYASPAFERADINHLLKLCDTKIAENKNSTFLDIGSDFGLYTIVVGNRYKENARVNIFAFEPAKSSYALLQENVLLNNLSHIVTTHNVGLLDKDCTIDLHFSPKSPGQNGVLYHRPNTVLERITAKRLDTIIQPPYKSVDCAILKIDVEGVEREVLEGAKQYIAAHKEVYAVIEDFTNEEILSYLKRNGATFMCKLTPYNSWWKLK